MIIFISTYYLYMALIDCCMHIHFLNRERWDRVATALPLPGGFHLQSYVRLEMYPTGTCRWMEMSAITPWTMQDETRSSMLSNMPWARSFGRHKNSKLTMGFGGHWKVRRSPMTQTSPVVICSHVRKLMTMEESRSLGVLCHHDASKVVRVVGYHN